MKDAGKVNIFKDLSPVEKASRAAFLTIITITLLIGLMCTINTTSYVNKPFPGFLVNTRMVVPSAGQYYWTGIKAGLKYPNRIVGVNGRDVESLEEIHEIVSRTGVDHPINYSVEKDGKIVDVQVKTMLFTWQDYLLTFGIHFLYGAIFLFLGVVVYILKPDTRSSWAFLLGCFFLSLSAVTVTNITELTWQRLNMFMSTMIPAAAFHLSFVFPEKRKFLEKFPRLQAIPYLFSILLGVPIVLIYPKPLSLDLYRFMVLYTAISTLSVLASTLHAFFQRSSPISRQRAKVVLIGVVLALPIPGFLNFLSIAGSDLVGKSILNNFLPLPVMIFPASIAYAIARHNLFDVDVFIKRTVGYVIMTVLVGGVYFSLQVGTKEVFSSSGLVGYSEKIYPVLFAILVVFFFDPLNRRIKGIVNKLFYRKKFDYKDTVVSVSNVLTSVLNLDEILKRIINTVRQEMFIDSAGVILFQPEVDECQMLFIHDVLHSNEEKIEEDCLASDDPLVTLIEEERKLITKYDVMENPRYSEVREACSQRFESLRTTLAIPLKYQDRLTGILALGQKKSGHFYTREDIELLETLTNQGAIAIENAKMAEQMKLDETVRANLARYLSPQIVEQIIHKDVEVNLGGARKEVTVLFSDIRGFTTLTETRPPDELVAILNEYFTEMAKIIFVNQGSLDKFVGDAIVAVFGSLIEVENSTECAVEAAISMMKRMPGLNEKWQREFDGFNMKIGIGINSGEVFLGNIGSPERMEFTVIGDTVNVASRFSDLAKPGQILLTQEAMELLSPDFSTQELSSSEVKGKSGILKVFEVI
jgi:class 3 adenylate cyclase